MTNILDLYIFLEKGEYKQILILPDGQRIEMQFFQITNTFMEVLELSQTENNIAGVGDKLLQSLEIYEPLKLCSNSYQEEHMRNFQGNLPKELGEEELKALTAFMLPIIDDKVKYLSSPFNNMDEKNILDEYKAIYEIIEIILGSSIKAKPSESIHKIIQNDTIGTVYMKNNLQLSSILIANTKHRYKARTNETERTRDNTNKKIIEHIVSNSALVKRYSTKKGIYKLVWAEITYAMENDIKLKKCNYCNKYMVASGNKRYCNNSCKRSADKRRAESYLDPTKVLRARKADLRTDIRENKINTLQEAKNKYLRYFNDEMVEYEFNYAINSRESKLH